MEQIVKDLQVWWSNNSYDVLSDVGSMSGAEVRDYVGDSCYASGEVQGFHGLKQEDQEKVLKIAFPNRKYGV